MNSIRLLFTHEFLNYLTLSYLPVRILFFHQLGFSNSQIFLLEVISASINLLTDIPMGAFTDRIGRKKSVIISHFLSLGIYIGMVTLKDFYFFCGLMVLQGLSFTFLSGSWDSLFYESLKSH